MGTGTPAYPDSLAVGLIAPCGMNCGLCIGYLRERNRCAGCTGQHDSSKPRSCVACSIRNCDELSDDAHSLCLGCERGPCARLRRLDKRYRTKYRMSMLENLAEVGRVGLEQFVESERLRWACEHCGALVSVHRTACLACGESVEGSHGTGLTSAST